MKNALRPALRPASRSLNVIRIVVFYIHFIMVYALRPSLRPASVRSESSVCCALVIEALIEAGLDEDSFQ